ncbi:MAG: hypothetical protein ACI312_00340 [Bacilli bacterium]
MKNIINFYKKHHKILIISFLLIIVISLLSGTYAMFQRIDKAEYANNYKTGNLQIEFTSISGTINLEKQVPITDEEGKNLTPYKFKITNVGNLAYTFDLKLVLDSNYIESHGCNDNIIPNEYIKVQLNNEEPILLSNLSNNTIISNITLQPSAYINFSLRMWIAEGSPNDIMGKHYHAKITSTGQAVSPENIIYNEPNAPVLADGMIPVTYDESKSTWVKADINNTNNSWYDYDNKKWANAVMVNTDKTSSVTNSKSRSEYMSSDIKTEVLEDDILAYYVWIPRYKYKLFNVDFEKINSQLIDIAFEKDTESTGKTICTVSEIGVETCTNKVNGNYYTHPAFTLGDTELSGIWVGKFETTGSETTPTIKPGITSLRSITVSSMYNTSKIFNTTAYLTETGVNQSDAHMMKNIEWGAVAYLKQSKYGLGTTDIAINNSSSFLTGRSSGDSTVTSNTSEGTYKYNESKIETTIVDGTGTNITVNTPTSDSTYTWTNIGTSASPIWKSATKGVGSSTTTLTYTFTITGTGSLSFDYSVSSESASYDYLYYEIKQNDTTIDNTGTTTKIGGTSYGTADDSMTYISKSHILSAGSYTLIFTYKKDSSVDKGTDSGYVKNVKIINNVETVVTNYGIENGGGTASTTGNITGVYDMSGGAWEYVMGNYNKTAGRSGLTVSNVPSKYIDIYAGDSVSYSHLGDALGETAGWYSDSARFVYSSSPWFVRGGSYNVGVYAGVFYFDYYAGEDHNYFGFRVVLSTTGA